MDLGLNGSVALVTGASRGIGLSIAQSLHAEGCSVAMNARSGSALGIATENLGARASAHAADVTDPVACKAMVDDVVARWGRLDVLVCNVGSGSSVSPGTETPEEWQRVFAMNLWSATNTISAALSYLEASRASVICISSICGIAALGAPLTYSAAKAALNSYVAGLARQLGQRGVRINVIAPGNILFEGGIWDRRVAQEPAAVSELLRREVALNRLGTPEEIAGFVAFLASKRASFATGATFVVDGGQLRS